MKESRKKSLKIGFTLIEILVVIAIIAILAALIFPVFSAAKRASKMTLCLSNLHQIGIANELYATDNNSTYAIGSDASTHFNQSSIYKDANNPRPLMIYYLAGYLHNSDVWRCPLDNGIYDTSHSSDYSQTIESMLPPCNSLNSKYGMSYGYFLQLQAEPKTSPITLLNLYHKDLPVQAAEIPIFYDPEGMWHGSINDRRMNAFYGDGHAAGITGVTLGIDQTTWQ